jgi:hypothetical protein
MTSAFDPTSDSPSPQQPFDPHHTGDLVQLIKDTADRLAGDNASRGDMKILSRAVRELGYAFKVFRPFRSRRKVTIFGSARTRPEEPAYRQAECFAKLIAEHGWLVVTGAASGIMEAGHRGAGRENSMGLNIMLPFEQESNPVIAGDPKLVHMKYFFTRKLMFVKECDAVCLLPGGFGTLDEALEVLTLLQTGKRDIVPVVMLDQADDDYWPAFLDFIEKHLLRRGLISEEDLRLLYRTDSTTGAVEHVLNFYRVYHSMRYVRSRLVLRLQTPISAAKLEGLNDEFDDILTSGRIEASPALPEEHDDPSIEHLPRLVLRFNRRNLGRLRQLIDAVNAPDDEAAPRAPSTNGAPT